MMTLIFLKNIFSVFFFRSHFFFHPEHRFEPGELSMGRYVNYPTVRKLFLDPFRRQIFTEDIEFEDR